MKPVNVAQRLNAQLGHHGYQISIALAVGDVSANAEKEATGKIVGNPSLELKGNVEKNLGKVQATVGDVRENMTKPTK